MKFAKLFLFSTILFSVMNCAELFQSDKKDNNDALFALLLNAGCTVSDVSAPASGRKIDFTACRGDANAALAASGFSSSSVSLSGGLVGTGSSSTVYTTASSLSSLGGNKKASIEIVYVLSQGDSSIDAILPSTTSLNGPGFHILPTTVNKIASNGSNSALASPRSWVSSVSAEKTLCLEVHEESGAAHVLGWESSCATASRGSYQFEEEPVAANFGGDRIGLRINKATVKSITIYSSNIGTSASIQ
ncbi:hypothetical protein EHQ68_05970 [Leptospira congkakensis]|uniref:Lipoprotein n=1 Tax=Leptospira congkakensis TaxID=2484932 RepID=A0A4Z1AHS4_9LEPT|nr:hypothetical protein [Leptospira congkakensis]TGL90957.1 hypothetical protein EHQ69_13730 [Leptospira congkakensis]TGL91966.1 hypothetical protein EHQ68_05970 [Leptospira congkakensis]TGL99016.1 hypothetical protein EHQ70_05565 [Leptospira congkakensis]